MAEKETIIPIKVDGTDAITTLKDLRNAIKANRDALVALGNVQDDDIDAKEKQNKIIGDLQKNTKLLNDVMRAGKAQSAESAKAVDIATGSYDELNAELRELRKTFHAMSAAERDSEFGASTIKRINELDVKLKDLDGSVGQFQRNVGNYGKTYAESLDSARESTDQLRTGFEAFNSMAILADDDASKLTKTIAGFQIVSNLLEGSKGIGGLVEKGKAWIQSMKSANAGTKMLTGSMVGETVATETATTATKAFRAALISTGIGAVVVAIGSLIAYWDDLVEWLNLGTKAQEDENEVSEKYTTILNTQSEAIDRNMRYRKANGASEEEILYQRMQSYNKLWQSLLDDENATGEARDEAYKKYMEAYDNWNIYQIEQERKKEDELTRIAEEAEEERQEARKRAAQERSDMLNAEYEEDMKIIRDAKERMRQNDMSDLDRRREKYEKEKMIFEENGVDTTALTEEYINDRKVLREKEMEDMHAFEEISAENILNKRKETGLAEVQVAEETSEEKKRISKEDVDFAMEMATTSTSAITSLLDTISEIYESNDEQDKKSQKKAKALRIASATIDMLQGATTAFASAMQLGPIAGPIVGAVNSAAVIASGIANINKIKAVSLEGTGGGASAPAGGSVTPPPVENLPPATRSLTGAKEEARLNRASEPQQVYILESQLEASANSRQVQVQETTF